MVSILKSDISITIFVTEIERTYHCFKFDLKYIYRSLFLSLQLPLRQTMLYHYSVLCYHLCFSFVAEQAEEK